MHTFKRRFHATLKYDVCNGMMQSRRHSTHGGKTCLHCKKSVYYPDAIKHREGIRELDVGAKETARRETSIRCHLRIPWTRFKPNVSPQFVTGNIKLWIFLGHRTGIGKKRPIDKKKSGMCAKERRYIPE